MDKLQEAAESLRAVAKRLNRTTDRANELVRRVEEFLNTDCSLGVYAGVRLWESTNEDGFPEYTDLVYARVGGRFRIALEHGSDAIDPDDFVITPLSECTREDKLASIEQLPTLLERIAAAAVARTDRAEETLKSVEAALSAFSPRKGE